MGEKEGREVEKGGGHKAMEEGRVRRSKGRQVMGMKRRGRGKGG